MSFTEKYVGHFYVPTRGCISWTTMNYHGTITSGRIDELKEGELRYIQSLPCIYHHPDFEKTGRVDQDNFMSYHPDSAHYCTEHEEYRHIPSGKTIWA